ncbi:hypothetical protein TYRP_007017 [Tyrophagus putrescentiae]|nr:hypothetical protein TYRP_007017 [Tyrophagus putrescentiae]
MTTTTRSEHTTTTTTTTATLNGDDSGKGSLRTFLDLLWTLSSSSSSSLVHSSTDLFIFHPLISSLDTSAHWPATAASC